MSGIMGFQLLVVVIMVVFSIIVLFDWYGQKKKEIPEASLTPRKRAGANAPARFF